MIVANLYEMYNFLIKEIDKPIKKEVLIENYEKILILMNPFIPHFTNECLSSINRNKITWPTVSKKDLIEDEINLVVQINGKKRALLNVKRDTNEKNILEEILSNQNTKKLWRHVCRETRRRALYNGSGWSSCLLEKKLGDEGWRNLTGQGV